MDHAYQRELRTLRRVEAMAKNRSRMMGVLAIRRPTESMVRIDGCAPLRRCHRCRDGDTPFPSRSFTTALPEEEAESSV